MKHIILEALNMSQNEKAVFKTLEKQKMGRTVSKIARDAGIPRTTTDYILRKFEKWKLVRKIYSRKRYHWLFNRMLRTYRVQPPDEIPKEWPADLNDNFYD